MQHRIHTLAWCLALIAGFVPPLAAQSTELVIRNNALFINGKRIPADQLPEALDLDGVTIQYTAMAPEPGALPLVSLNGILFTIAPDGLEHTFGGSLAGKVGDTVERITFYSEHVAELAQGMQVAYKTMSSEVDAIQGMEVMRYLGEIQEDNELFGLLSQEFTMESGASKLAAEIRRMAEGEEQNQRMDLLRQRLGEIFTLKQDNRRREMEKLEEKLRVLQERLEMREALRDEIIDQRLQELLSNHN